MENFNVIQCFVLIFFTFIANSTLLFGATSHVDSWIVIRWLSDKNYIEMKSFYNKVGIPQFYFVFKWLWRLSNNNLLLTGRILFIIKVLHVVLIYQILLTEINYHNTLAFLISLFLTVYTGNTFINDFVVGVQYSLSWTFYLLGIFLILKSEIFSGSAQYTLIILGFLIVIYSFGMKSLLFVNLFLASGLVASDFVVVNNNSNLDLVVKIFLLLLTFIYWICVEFLWPRSGAYKDYNKFLLPTSFHKIIKKLFIGTARSLIEPNINALKNLNSPIFGLILVLFWLISNNSFRIMYESQSNSEINGRGLILLSLLLASVMIFPYALVNQDFDSQGYLTKNFVMLDLAFSFFVVGIIETFLFGNSKIYIYILAFATLLYSKLKEDYILMLQYAKQIALQQALSKLNKEHDIYFRVFDNTDIKQKGLKNILYPMTLFYMSNQSKSEKVIFGEDYTYRDGPVFNLKQIRENYLRQPVPFSKKRYNPKTYFEINILNGVLSTHNIVKFYFQQFGQNPIAYTSVIHLFEVKVHKSK